MSVPNVDPYEGLPFLVEDETLVDAQPVRQIEWPRVVAPGTPEALAHVESRRSADDLADDDFEAELDHNRDVADELRRLKVRKAAEDALRAESEPEAQPFDGWHPERD